MDKLNLTDLIDIEMLQKIQNAFSMLTGLSCHITDANAVPITEGSCCSEFCMKYTRTSALGRFRCKSCDKHGAELALEKGSSVAYYCHAGLMDFAAPIMAGEELVGCIIGGQVLTNAPDLEHFREVAEELEIDPDEYIEAVQKVNIIPAQDICKAADFLYELANALSNITYHKHQVLHANIEIEKAARMKSDFLANMSHEIRTPMNAVIGMAEMALREDLPPVARNYINQIKASGKTLLTIINDILDFSKIESGKMDITIAEYAPMSIIHDVVNIIMTRIGDKDVELILDIAPDLPYELLGDSTRIKQILVNLSNNAVKFTNSGQVLIKMDCMRRSDKLAVILASIEDTGIGIKKDDIGKLFQSFQQLDSKRNRNIEGTGLGLAISKQLLTLMNGDIRVESEYGKGSIFSFVLPQDISNPAPSILLRQQEPIIVAAHVHNPYVKQQLEKDIVRLGGLYIPVETLDELSQLAEKNIGWLFVEQELFSSEIEEFIRVNPQITGVLILPYHGSHQSTLSNLLMIKKPLYSLNLATIFNHEDLFLYSGDTSAEVFDFVAPDAEILIVDDNAINLTVAEGLLEPMKMKIETALSGKEAIAKISVKHYDLIFMDHMMPELDGVETTHIIRRFHAEYDDVPIIALTANAVDGTKEMFLREGMNDFVAKPIEVRVITSKLRRWLPSAKVHKIHTSLDAAVESSSPEIEISGLDTHSALKLLGSEKLFWDVLRDYYKVILKKMKIIKELELNEDLPGYTIEVHALKSASRQIGATNLANLAADLEQAGNAGNLSMIHQKTNSLLDQYYYYYEILKSYFPEIEREATAQLTISADILHAAFADMRNAIENLDLDQMEAVIQEMKPYRFEGWQKELFEQLQNAVEDINVDACGEIIDAWERKL